MSLFSYMALLSSRISFSLMPLWPFSAELRRSKATVLKRQYKNNKK